MPEILMRNSGDGADMLLFLVIFPTVRQHPDKILIKLKFILIKQASQMSHLRFNDTTHQMGQERAGGKG